MIDLSVLDNRVNLKYFTHEELACKESGKVKLGLDFAVQLDKLRDAVGFPLTVNSCCRSFDHNKAVGGHPRSLHVYDKPARNTDGCIAIDISRPRLRDGQMTQLIYQAWARGWSYGINKQFIHLDRRTTLGMEQKEFVY